ncbi:MAG: thioredoxin family protein [Thermoplasmata archaeon]|nr:MAG: thioredoxin family protein [Thermoplasmata archaeon]
MKIELFYNPTCHVCPIAKKMVAKVVKKYPQVTYEELNAFEHQERVLSLGFQMVPAIVIDDEVWHAGGLPDKKALKKEIKSRLAKG